MKRISLYISLLTVLLSFSLLSCRDDLLYDPEIGEGESQLSMTMEFEPLTSALESRASGTAVNTIDNITVIAYDRQGKFVKLYKQADGDLKALNITETNTEMPNPDPDKYHQAQAKTQRATFNIPDFPFGRYRIYAVANQKIEEDNVQTEEDLKNIMVEWKTDVTKDNAMFGYFDTGKTTGTTSFDANTITINRSTTKLYSWIRRCVSKVTVAFDGAKLKDNVRIYIKTVQIKDIPKYCYLGKPNVPTSKDSLIADGETITLWKAPDGSGDDESIYNASWLAQVSNAPGSHIYGFAGKTEGSDEEQIEKQHAEDVQALYFFENIQPTGIKNTESDKRQDAWENGTIAYPGGVNSDNKAYKDATPYGSYIEVEAYYISNNTAKMGRGKIIYRFMLGKDTHLDYSAERNYHYKLTMRFKGYGNDVDWHIEYNQPPLNFPNPYYISYLYNHSMMCPLEINAGKRTVKKITASIVQNRWYPEDAPGSTDTVASGVYYNGSEVTGDDRKYNGFLSLYETDRTVITKSAPWDLQANEAYYLGKGDDGNRNRGYREYTDFSNGKHQGNGISEDDVYSVQMRPDEKGDNIYKVSIPMYTRAKQLIKPTGYTGNNPYDCYKREARVKFTVTFSDNDSITQTTTINQVKRIVNPKGVYRDWNESADFHVQLKERSSETDASFTNYQSQGPWKAYVVKPVDLAKAPPFHVKTTSGVVKDTVEGSGGVIDFYIDFKDVKLANAQAVPQCAVVRVEYNNMTCQHLIFLRKGYAPKELYAGGAKWHISNLKNSSGDTGNPLDPGALFKFGNIAEGIADVNNENGWGYDVFPSPGRFTANVPGNKELTLADGGSSKWSDIKHNDPRYSVFSSSFNVATYKDYRDLYDRQSKAGDKDDKDGGINQGYGVLYGGGATETATTLAKAYGYTASIEKDAGEYGMRGCFVYNRRTGDNVFFPIGRSGYGHRKETQNGPDGKVKAAYSGILRYSSNPRWGIFNSVSDSYPQGVSDCPIFYDIFRRQGAVYWLQQGVTQNTLDGGTIYAWDFNYFSFDFYEIGGGNLVWGADACYVRCVD